MDQGPARRKLVAQYTDVLDISDLQTSISDAIEKTEIESEEWENSSTGEEHMISSCSGSLNCTNYEWRIYPSDYSEEGPDYGYYVEEIRRMKPVCTAVFALALMTISGLVLLGVSPEILPIDQIGFFSLDLPLFFDAIVYTPPAFVLAILLPIEDSLLTDTVEKDAVVRNTGGDPVSLLSLYLMFCIILIYVFFVFKNLYIKQILRLVFIGMFLLSTVFVLQPDLLEDIFIEIKSIFGFSRIPRVAVSYSSTVIFTGIMFVMAVSFCIFVIRSDILLGRELAAILLIASAGVTWSAYIDTNPDSHTISFVDLINDRSFSAGELEEYDQGRRTGLFLVSLTSYVFLAAVLMYYSVFPVNGDLLFLAAPFILFSYFILGFISQSASLIRLYARILTSNTFDQELPIDVDAEVRVSSSMKSATAISTVTSDYILISSQLVKELDSGPLSAVIAHEEAHIKNNDSRLALYLNGISPILLVGVNVLYSIFNFSAREAEADRQAVQRVGKNELISALETAENATDSADSLSGNPEFLPFVEIEAKSILEMLFGEFFGSFGLSQAHPPTEKRKEYVRGL